MANAFIAVSDDGTAASWNPAGLAQLRSPEFSLVTSYDWKGLASSGFVSPDGLDTFSPTRLSYSTQSVDFASATVPLDLFSKPVTLQAGWQRIYDLTFHSQAAFSELALNPSGPQGFLINQDTDLDGNIHLYSLSGAIQLTKRTALGASINFWEGDWRVGTHVGESLVSGGAPLFQFLDYRQQNHISGNNFDLGLLLSYPKFSVGLVYHSPFYASYHFSTSVRSNIPSPLLGDSKEETELRFPKRLGLGVAWRPTDTWTVDLDIKYNQWRGMTVSGVPGEFPTLNFFDFQPAGQTSTRNTYSANLGAEYLVVREKFVIPIRFGIAYEPQGGMDPTLKSPVNYTTLAIGTGYNTNRFKLDAAIQYRRASYRTGQFIEPTGMLRVPRSPDAFGNVKSEEWRVNLSAIYRMPESNGLKKALRTVFVGD